MAVLHWLAWLLRILWACRISVINAVASLLFFGFIVQGQNLMADLSSWGNTFSEFFFWAGVFGLTALVWAFPVHYGARRTLDEPSWVLPRALYAELEGRCADQVHVAAEDHEVMIRWIPRILGLAPFAALALGIWGALSALEGASDLSETTATRVQAYWLYGADAVTALTFLVLICLRKRLVPTDWTGDILHPLALVATAALFFVAYVWPIWASVHLPRALLVPPLFGSLVLLLSWLQRLGHRTGFPFLTALAVMLAVATGLNVDFDRIRTVPATSGDPRMTIDDALAAWRTANKCDKDDCPKPLIVSIDGGASRAAFTAATFIGDLLDRMPAPKTGEAATPARRIFAISGVSGGSYGAAVIQSALADSQAAGPSRTPPCRSAQTTWFGYEHWLAHDRAFNWRQCLQALTSGDYLSATIVGLGFRDYMAPPWQKIGLPAMPDRAALLEMTWERQYAATMEPDTHFFEHGTECGPDAGKTGLCRAAAHAGAFETASGTGRWIPLLLLNGTSVATGRRIISSDFTSTPRDPNRPKLTGALYGQAYDLREAMSKPCPEAAEKDHRNTPMPLVGTCDKVSSITGPDVRLSTAAALSARFPVISPAGIFDMQPDEGTKTRYGDQIVDGGYFENSGLTSALDIAAALEARGVHSIVVSISNDPVRSAPSEKEIDKCAAHQEAGTRDGAKFSIADCTGLPQRPATTPRVFVDDNTFLGRVFGLLSRPFQALVATGNGHADEALGIAETNPGGFYRLRVQVKPDFKEKRRPPVFDPTCAWLKTTKVKMTNVSMSWWLAAATQADLDVQRCSNYNQTVLAALLKDAADRSPNRH